MIYLFLYRAARIYIRMRNMERIPAAFLQYIVDVDTIAKGKGGTNKRN